MVKKKSNRQAKTNDFKTTKKWAKWGMMKVVRALTSRPIFDQHVSNEFGRVQHDLRDNEYDVGGYDEH